MRVITLYENGFTMGTAPSKNDHEREKRGEVVGWSPSAARRNLAFLRSVNTETLTEYGYTATFTLKNCPDTSDRWKRLREALFKRFFRDGMVRGHWVTEWQTRGVPHLHGIFYFKEQVNPAALIAHWLAVAQEFVVSPKAQHVREVTHIVGWFKYMAKHASRGHAHYQRTKDAIPEGWQKTGRVWGYVGDWKIEKPRKLTLDAETFYKIRRLVRYKTLANVREPIPAKDDSGKVVAYIKDGKAISRARRMLKHNDADWSRLGGSSEWQSTEFTEKMLIMFISQGSKFALKDGGLLEVIGNDIVDRETGEIINKAH